MKEPVVGEQVYVPSSFYMSRGEDDFSGGLATIEKVECSFYLPPGHHNYTMVGIKERPGVLYNWTALMDNQEAIAKAYAGKIAHADPDYDPQFNDS